MKLKPFTMILGALLILLSIFDMIEQLKVIDVIIFLVAVAMFALTYVTKAKKWGEKIIK